MMGKNKVLMGTNNLRYGTIRSHRGKHDPRVANMIILGTNLVILRTDPVKLGTNTIILGKNMATLGSSTPVI